ncbi:MAG: biotin/lipoyl-binding protein, partial [Candidatus Wildermuthbacteria bacterium]|nr:biotin/lipoyl-binding protein [Candidatus Wildermuthbacteria bacterium]
MKDKLKNLIQGLALRQTRSLAALTILILIVVTAGVFTFYKVSRGSTVDTANAESAGNDTASDIDPIVAVVGEEDSSIIGNTVSNNSWSGEIISLNNLQVQPEREGTIVEWKVNIGQKVQRGQVLARLSAPPATPELTETLAEQAQNLTKARATADAQATFVEKNKQQLMDLRTQIVQSGKQISDTLSDDIG